MIARHHPEVVVAGAGPAGAIAARELARHGRHVLLVDRDVATKPGEALPGAACRLLRSLELPAPDASGHHLPIGGNASSWGHDTLTSRDFFREPDGPGWRVNRRVFEEELRAHAGIAGVTSRIGLVRHVSDDGDGLTVTFDDGATTRTRWVVDATGRSARVARQLGARRIRDRSLVAVCGYGRLDNAAVTSRTVIEAVPNGWWYGAALPGGAAVFMLHTLPEDARPLIVEPALWHAALARTRHLHRALPATDFSPPHGADASSARIDRVSGPRWITCGDATLSFDPIAAQGLFSALHGGMKAAAAVDAALSGDPSRLVTYALQTDEIWATYRQRARQVYRTERRWPDEPFWVANHQ